MGALDDTNVSVFLFGDVNTHYTGTAVSVVFALFNNNICMDNGLPFVDLNFDLLDWAVCYSCVADADMIVLCDVCARQRLLC
jgi:hypothetical protein